MTIHFENVGAQKKSWSATIPAITHSVLMAQIRSNHALMSRDIDFWLNEDGDGGRIIVGVCRPAGTFRIDGGVSLGAVEL
jgi:hypothetical protein